jgi:hypothetical protein
MRYIILVCLLLSIGCSKHESEVKDILLDNDAIIDQDIVDHDVTKVGCSVILVKEKLVFEPLTIKVNDEELIKEDN